MMRTPAVAAVLVLTAAFVMASPSPAVADTGMSCQTSAPSLGAEDSGNMDQPQAAQSGPETQAVALGSFEFRPRVVNLDSSGRYVTGLLILPEGRTVRDVFIPSVQLNGVVYASTEFSPHNPVVDYQNKGSLMLKFEKERVRAILSPGADIPVWVSGWFTDGTPFIAWGEVTVIS